MKVIQKDEILITREIIELDNKTKTIKHQINTKLDIDTVVGLLTIILNSVMKGKVTKKKEGKDVIDMSYMG